MKMTRTTCSILVLLCLGVFALSGCALLMDLLNPVTDMGTVPWTENAAYLWDKKDLRFSFTFAPGGDPTGLDIYGTDCYSLDSPIGVAAVHAGLVSFAAGGKVTIRIRMSTDQQSFPGTLRNGVMSSDISTWGYYEFSE